MTMYVIEPEFGVSRHHSVCVKSEWCQAYRGFYIYKEWDKCQNQYTGELFGRAKLYYALYVPDGSEEILTESFQTLREAKKYIDYITS